MDQDRQPSTGGDFTPVDHALGQLLAGLDHLVEAVEEGGLDHYDNDQLVGFAQAFERFRNPVVAGAGAGRPPRRRLSPPRSG